MKVSSPKAKMHWWLK